MESDINTKSVKSEMHRLHLTDIIEEEKGFYQTRVDLQRTQEWHGKDATKKLADVLISKRIIQTTNQGRDLDNFNVYKRDLLKLLRISWEETKKKWKDIKF